jgi:ribosome-binding protein aMBF1 (putative translation factor)
MSTSPSTPGSAIAAAAARRGWDSDELADRIQVNRSMVAAWMDGSEEPPERFHRRLAETLEFTAAELAALTGQPITEAPPTEPVTEPVTEPESPIEPVTEPEPEPPPPRTGAEEASPAPRHPGMTAGRAIQEARRRKGWTTRELASAIHYRRSEIDSWEDDAAVPWKFAARAMTEILDFTDDETAAVERAVGDA